jgi:hypothetical protein
MRGEVGETTIVVARRVEFDDLLFHVFTSVVRDGLGFCLRNRRAR